MAVQGSVSLGFVLGLCDMNDWQEISEEMGEGRAHARLSLQILFSEPNTFPRARKHVAPERPWYLVSCCYSRLLSLDPY